MSDPLIERRERVLAEAVAAGKIADERREAYRRMWNKDPVATERLLAELAPGLAAIPSISAEQPLPREWFPSLANADRRAGTERQPVSAAPPPAGQVEAEALPWVKRPKPARQGRVTIADD